MADSKRLSLGGRVATPRVPMGMSMDQVVARALGASVRIQTAAPKPRTLTGYLFALSPSSPCLTLSQTPLPTSSTSTAAAATTGPSSSSGTSTPIAPPPTSYTVLALSAIQSITVLELGPGAAATTGAAAAGGAGAASGSGRSTPTGAGAGAGGSTTPVRPTTGGGGSTTTPTPTPPQVSQPLPLPPLDAASAGQRAANAVSKLHAAEARRGKGVTREAQQLFDALHRTLPVAWDGTRIVVLESVVIGPPYNAADCRSVRKGGNAQELARVKKVVESERKKIAAANGASASASASSRGTPELKKGG